MPYEPVSRKAEEESILITASGTIPKKRHRKARTVMPVIMEKDDSPAFSACLLRGIPKKDMPNAFTKHAAARAPVRASAAPPKAR